MPTKGSHSASPGPTELPLPWPLERFSGALIVSPHCDDAVFSMGLLLRFLCGSLPRVDILTCFSVSNWDGRSAASDVESVTRLRKAEDRRMVERLEPTAPTLHYLDLPDAPLRPGRTLKNLYDGRIRPVEREYVSCIREALRRMLKPDDLLLYPLAIGRHIDHVLARQATAQVADGHAVWACYEDQPYLARAVSPGSRAWQRGKASFLFESRVGKAELLDCYASQLMPRDRRAMMRYARRLAKGGKVAERFWTSPRVLRGERG